MKKEQEKIIDLLEYEKEEKVREISRLKYENEDLKAKARGSQSGVDIIFISILIPLVSFKVFGDWGMLAWIIGGVIYFAVRKHD